MKRVYGSDDRLLVSFLHELLVDAGIECMVRNDYLGGGIGELPPNETWPEIWVVDSDDFPRARRLVDAHLAGGDAPPWTCPGCGEAVEGQFVACWRCGREAPDERLA